ncbi:uncharacterized protein TNCV_2991221 [Trichonephila clavipes]|nr:uncharacterized protein TNCV_2991221 [Trichonephila clavipes]
MSPGRCSTGLTTPRHTEYQIINLILGNITPLIKQGPPKFWKTDGRGLTGCNSSAKHIPHMLYWIQVRQVCWSIHTGDITRLKAFVYNVCTVRMGVVIHKQKFSTHGAPKQTYLLFQNDIPIDVACHRYTLNMQVSSVTKNNSSRNEPSCTTVMVSFNGVLLVVTGTWRFPY